jgi:hypothetical protein
MMNKRQSSLWTAEFSIAGPSWCFVAVQGPCQEAGLGLSEFTLIVVFRPARVSLVNPTTAFTPPMRSITHL